ncbi:Carbohydrate sulfotransferase, partial [Gryllus bimaculatus]
MARNVALEAVKHKRGNYVLEAFALSASWFLALQQAVLPRPAAAAAAEEEEEEGGGLDARALEAEMEARRRRVRRVCAERGLQREGEPNAWEFFIDSRHSLVWCNVFKAASTAWLYNFNLLAGYSESFLRRSLKMPLVLARARYPRPTPQQLRAALPDSLSFLIVRDPFERLLSAYRNKFEGLRNRFYRKLGREISSRQPRRASPPPAPPAPHPNAVDSSGDAPDPRLPGPTFEQFVDHVIATGLRAHKPKFDEHWAPYYRFCTPCHVNFTVIAKVETLSRDEEYIIDRAGLRGALLAAARRRERPRKVTNRARGAKATADLVARYYATLTRGQLRDLYRIYGTDFDLFGYNASKGFCIKWKAMHRSQENYKLNLCM